MKHVFSVIFVNFNHFLFSLFLFNGGGGGGGGGCKLILTPPPIFVYIFFLLKLEKSKKQTCLFSNFS